MELEYLEAFLLCQSRSLPIAVVNGILDSKLYGIFSVSKAASCSSRFSILWLKAARVARHDVHEAYREVGSCTELPKAGKLPQVHRQVLDSGPEAAAWDTRSLLTPPVTDIRSMCLSIVALMLGSYIVSHVLHEYNDQPTRSPTLGDTR